MGSYRPTLNAEVLESLAMLYLQKQDLSNLSPTQLLEKYIAVYAELKETETTIKETERK